VQAEGTRQEIYASFVEEVQDRLRHALVARFGLETGREAAADALGYGWEHWDRIRGMDNPAGYLYRVGQHKAMRRLRPRPLFPAPPARSEPLVEPKLPAALAALTAKQRQAVALVHGYQMTHQETADLLGVSRGSVQRHLERGLAKLRDSLGVNDV
jgi:RNA polymerase sigma-70 factor (ECF subfamily)